MVCSSKNEQVKELQRKYFEEEYPCKCVVLVIDDKSDQESLSVRSAGFEEYTEANMFAQKLETLYTNMMNGDGVEKLSKGRSITVHVKLGESGSGYGWIFTPEEGYTSAGKKKVEQGKELHKKYMEEKYTCNHVVLAVYDNKSGNRSLSHRSACFEDLAEAKTFAQELKEEYSKMVHGEETSKLPKESHVTIYVNGSVYAAI